MFGEVVICQFPFTSGAVSKRRPALVLFDLQLDVIICRITSAQRSGPFDILLTDWQAAGLLRPSVARLDRIVTAARLRAVQEGRVEGIPYEQVLARVDRRLQS